MNLNSIILALYPNAIPNEEFLVKNDGEKQFIARWKLDVPQPTVEELDYAWFKFKQEQKIIELNDLCNRQISDGFLSPSTGFEFEFEIHDQNNLTQQAILLLNDESILEVTWKTKNSGIQLLSREQFFIILKESEAHKREAIAKFWMIKAQVEQAESLDEVEKIYW